MAPPTHPATFASFKAQIRDVEAQNSFHGRDRDDSDVGCSGGGGDGGKGSDSRSSRMQAELKLAVRAADLAVRCLQQVPGLSGEEKSEMRGVAKRNLLRAEGIKKGELAVGGNLLATSSTEAAALTSSFTSTSISTTASTSFSAAAAATAATSPSSSRKFKEPVSRRKLPNSEQIILLKASRLNGFKFPPWQDGATPGLSEFKLDGNGELFTDNPELSLSEHQREIFKGWLRPSEALPTAASANDSKDTSFSPTMVRSHPMDLIQDATTNCSVIASMCSAAARAEQGHVKLLRDVMYPWDEAHQRPMISPSGRYQIRLNFNGCYRRVDIDDRLPASGNERLLHTIDRNNPRLLWPMLIEKAYLKVRGGYDFAGSNSNTDLWVLCGWIPEQIFLQDAADFDSVDVWDKMLLAWRAGDVLITMGTGLMRKRNERELGLAGQHDYAVLDLRDVDGQQRILMKNPWREGASWKGGLPNATRNDEESLENEIQALKIESTDNHLPPGTFWIGWSDILQYFESIYLNWTPCNFRHREDIHFTWNLAANDNRSVNGSFINNPQFTIKAAGKGTLWLLLCRHFQDSRDNVASSGEFLGHMSLYVYQSSGEKMYAASVPLLRSRYVDSPQTLVQLDMPRDTASRSTTYTAVVSEQELPSIEHSFSLIAFSDMPVELSPAHERFPFCAEVNESWTSSSAGGSSQTPSYFSNPQFSLTLTRPSEIGLALETRSDPTLRMNVKLVQGGGDKGGRVVSLSQQSIALDSGPYKPGLAFSSTSSSRSTLSAGTYTVIPSTFEANQRASFHLRVYSHDGKASLRLLPPENAGMLPLILPPPRFPQHATQIVLPITILRNVNMTAVVERSRQRITQPRSPIRVSLQLGHGPSCNVIRESSPEGEYLEVPPRSRLSNVKLSRVNLWPETLRVYGGYCFLVLERMVAASATTGRIISGDSEGFSSNRVILEEEEFEVCIYCDNRPAEMIQIGAWGEM